MFYIKSGFIFLVVSAWFGTRHLVTFMLFLGMANAYVMRTNMSVAIVAMVNHTAIEAEADASEEAVDDECDAYLGNVSIYLFRDKIKTSHNKVFVYCL